MLTVLLSTWLMVVATGCITLVSVITTGIPLSTFSDLTNKQREIRRLISFDLNKIPAANFV